VLYRVVQFYPNHRSTGIEATPDCKAAFTLAVHVPCFNAMKNILICLSVAPLLLACAAGGIGAARDPSPLDADAQAQVVQDLLGQATDNTVNRLGRPDGYGGDPRVQIRMPEALARLEKTLRRLGQERYAEEFVESMNRAAEAAAPSAKPILTAAVRKLQPEDAVSIVQGNHDAATRYFRTHTEAELMAEFKPIIARATAQAEVTAAYKRMLRKSAFLDKRVDPARLDLDAYVTQAALDGLFVILAEEERRIRQDPRARTTELLKKAFR
jgi:hypothetical protein